MMVQSLRFQEQRDTGGHKRYAVYADNTDAPAVTCNLSRKGVWDECTFVDASNTPAGSFAPARKFMNKSWRLCDVGGESEGRLELSGTGWRFALDEGDTCFSLGDPRRWGEKLIETALNSWPDRYVFAVNNREIGQLSRLPRDKEDVPQGRIAKLKSLFKQRDWTAEFHDGIRDEDAKKFVAATILLIEITDRGARAG